MNNKENREISISRNIEIESRIDLLINKKIIFFDFNCHCYNNKHKFYEITFKLNKEMIK